jgi:predicted Zn-ribbon and HTH transcriptional regulator
MFNPPRGKPLKLSLHFTKNYNIKDYLKPSYIRIAVIDLDRSKEYPANFVCILPRRNNPNAKIQNKFQQKYGDQSPEIIKKLLDQALKTEDDQDIKKELLARLKMLNPKPKNMAKCNKCGKEFKSRKYRYGRQKTCYECTSKRYTDKDE